MNTAVPAQAQPATATCSVCKCESPLVEYFRRTMRGTVCPRCMPQASSRTVYYVFGFFVLFGVGAALLLPARAGNARWLPLLTMLSYMGVMFVILCLHEAIHALAARLLGGRVFEVALGFGERRAGFEWRGTRFSLRQGLFVGYCAAAFPERARLRLRWLIFVAAPLTVQILLVFLLWPSFNLRNYGTQVGWLETFVIVNVIVIVANLYPRRFTAIMATDGQLLIDLVRGRKTDDELHALYFQYLGLYAYEHEDYPAMLAASEAGIARYPENKLLRNNLAGAYLIQDRYGDALALFDQFLAAEAPAPSLARGLYQCNRAAALLHLALEPAGISAAQFASAQASAAEAYALLPWLSPVRVERAFAAYLTGDPAAALAQLEEELPLQTKNNARAGVLAEMALAQHALGQSGAAHASLAAAWRVYPKGDRTLTRAGEIVGYPAPGLSHALQS